MPSPAVVKVSSPSFSRHPDLRAALLKRFPRAAFNDTGNHLAGEALLDYFDGADGVVVGLETVDEALLGRLPGLRIVAKYGVGLDNIDLDACARRGVVIGWSGGVNRISVAEQTLCFMLGLTRNLFSTAFLLRDGVFRKDGGRQLNGRTVGIIGAGHIGKEVIRLLQPFDCRILVNDILEMTEYAHTAGVTLVDKDELFSTADIVSLHLPLTPQSKGLVNAGRLAGMRKTAFLINTARGALVDQQALKTALATGVIAGAAIDVFDREPPDDLDFLRLPNLVCTPHIGGNAEEAVRAMGMSAVAHLERFFQE